jgi:hypothetical protein
MLKGFVAGARARHAMWLLIRRVFSETSKSACSNERIHSNIPATVQFYSFTLTRSVGLGTAEHV